MKKLTGEWVRKAEADFLGAQKLGGGEDRLYDQVCFFCQQASEIYLKALLQEIGKTIPHTHELGLSKK